MPNSTSFHKYKMGEPVWASLEGYPWWPGRIVTIDDVTLGEQRAPKLSKDKVLVEFFNDDKRFAPMRFSSLRPFLDERCRALNQDYIGPLIAPLNQAIREAEEYIKSCPHGCNEESLKQASKQPDRESLQGDASEWDFYAEKRKSVKMVKRKKSPVENEPEGKRGAKRVKDEVITTVIGENSVPVAKRQKYITHPPLIRDIERIPVPQTPSRHDRPRGRQSMQDKALPSSMKKRSHAGQVQALQLDNEKPFRPKMKKNDSLKDILDKARARHNEIASGTPQNKEKTPQEKKGSLMKSSSVKKRVSSRIRTQHIKKKDTRDREEDTKYDQDVVDLEERDQFSKVNIKDCALNEDSPEENGNAPYKDEAQDDEAMNEVLMYHDYSKRDLLLTIRELEHELRRTRGQVWDLHLEQTAPETDRDSFTPEIEPLIRALKRYLEIVEGKESQEELKLTETNTIRLIKDLLRRPFHPKLLRENEATAQKLIKLADKSLDHSLPIARLMRELLMLWMNEVERYMRTEEKERKETETSESSRGQEKRSSSKVNATGSRHEEGKVSQLPKLKGPKNRANNEENDIEMDAVERKKKNIKKSLEEGDNREQDKTKQDEHLSVCIKEHNADEDGDVIMEHKNHNKRKSAEEGRLESKEKTSTKSNANDKVRKADRRHENVSKPSSDHKHAPMATDTAGDPNPARTIHGQTTSEEDDAEGNEKRTISCIHSAMDKDCEIKSDQAGDLPRQMDGDGLEKMEIVSSQSSKLAKKGSDLSLPSKNRTKNRIMKFTREKCLQTLRTILSLRFHQTNVNFGKTTLNEDTLKQLAENLEEQIRPRREKNMKGYYNCSRVLLKSLSKANEAVQDVLKAMTHKSYAAVFMKKCLDGEFKNGKMGKKNS